VTRGAAQRFWAAVRRTADPESDGEAGIRIEPIPGRPREAQRENRAARPAHAGRRPNEGRRPPR
jgi:hypothetical protein